MTQEEDDDRILINDNPEYNDYLREGWAGCDIPWSYEIEEAKARKAARDSYPFTPQQASNEVQWWVVVLVLAFMFLFVLAFACGA